MKKAFFSAAEAEAKKDVKNWGSLQWLANAELGNADGLTVGRVVITQGKCNPRHAHPNCEEVLYLLAGKLEHTIGEEKIVLNPGDALTVSAGVFHNATSIGDQDADMIVVYSDASRGFVPES